MMEGCFGGVYKGKKVLVTGHTGFKGSWVSLFLSELGAEVLGYALEPITDQSLFYAIGLKDKIHHIIGDIRDESKLLSVFKDFKPTFVFHMAAQPLVRLSYKEPKLTYETNIMGTVNLFECVRKIDSVRVVVNVTSDKCYQNKEWVWGYREDDPMGGYDPYSASKGSAELITSAYRTSYFNVNRVGDHRVVLSSVRAGNVIGGGDWAEDRLVPDCIRALSKDKEIAIRNPRAIRPWQYVLDPLSGYLWTGAKMYSDHTFGCAWNFGPGDSDMLTVEEVVRLVVKYWGKGCYSVDNSHNPHEARLLKLDCSKARILLEWAPVYDVRTAIKETVDWYSDYYREKKDMLQLTIDKIKDFVLKAREKVIVWSNVENHE